MKPLTRFAQVGGPISAPLVVADVDADGGREVIAVADAIYAWRADGSLLPGFPVRGHNAFASRPVIADVNNDGAPEIVVGCDDNAVYVLDGRGRLLPGWPVWTERDVYSSPAVVDVDGDGRPEVVVGSDDGQVYIWRHDGTPLPGWPRSTDGFVAASPQVVDVDGDGALEVVAASWDGRVYIWRVDGRPVPGWPRATGHFIWASPVVADVNGDTRAEVVVASDKVYIWRHDGTPLPGWPRPTVGYNVATPLVVDWDGDGRLEVIQAGGAFHAWRDDGTPLPGFPVMLSAFVWAPPVPVPGGPGSEMVVAGWDGRVWAVDIHGRKRLLAALPAPVFVPLTRWSSTRGLIGDWLGSIYWLDWCGTGEEHLSREKTHWPVVDVVAEGGTMPIIAEGIAPFVRLPPTTATQGVLWYRAVHEGVWHPVPLVQDRGRLTGLIQPFLGPTEVTFWAHIWDEGTAQETLPVPGRCYGVVPQWPGARRLPDQGAWSYRVPSRWGPRVRRWWQRWRAGSLWARRAG